MTIKFTIPRKTESLIDVQQPELFPINIPFQHHQLKNHISTRDGDCLYYASDFEIFALHLPTNQRRLVQLLKFRPCCLDAAHNWICVGGKHKGQCAFIEIKRPADHSSSRSSYAHPAEVDDLLPLDLDPDSRALIHHGSSTPPSSPWRRSRYILHEFNLGGDIMNSVAVQLLPGGREGLEDETVAVLTNNDHTVRIFSLNLLVTLATLHDYPCHMNHATISPDGNLLIAVGDAPLVFFHRRFFNRLGVKSKSVWESEWLPVYNTLLPQVPEDDGNCFATAFSPSGHVCAAASENGLTTVFNSALIQEESSKDPVIGVIKPSRGAASITNKRTAIRSMSFSPAPWDLLALAEEQGRVNVVDLRGCLQAVQTLALQISPKLTMVEIRDGPGTGDVLGQRRLDIERRFLESHNDALAAQHGLASATNSTDYLSYTAEQRRRERDDLNAELAALRSDPHRLSESERRMIDAIGRHRLRLNNSDLPSPISSNYSSLNRYLPPTPPWDGSGPVSYTPSRASSNIADHMRQRNSERWSRGTSERTYQPRRRSSIVISNSNNTQGSTALPSLAPLGPDSRTLSASPSRLPSTSSNDFSVASGDEAWNTISTALSSSRETLDRMRRIDSTAANIRTIERRIQTHSSDENREAESQQLRTLQQLTSRNEQQRQLNLLHAQRLSILRGHPRHSDESETGFDLAAVWRGDAADGVLTMGLGWSADGQELYVATVDGILRYRVNVPNRKGFAAAEWL